MNLSKLLQETVEAYYWIGFMIADGYFSETNRLSVVLSDKDIGHLKKLSKFLSLKITIREKTCFIRVQNKEIISKIKEKFDLSHQKTYNPPKLSFFSSIKEELYLALMIGYIDGDGNIQNQSNRKDCSLRIKVHKTWLDFLFLFKNYLSDKLKIEIPCPKINNQGYAQFVCGNIKVLRYLKLKIKELNIPNLRRKWDKIQTNTLSRYEWKEHFLPKVQELRKSGFTYREIASSLNLSASTICHYVNGRVYK